jgi:hypothetical protein
MALIREVDNKDLAEAFYELENAYSGSAIRLRLATYVACFSAERDDLSQWRAYAGDGAGYALGFSTGTQFSIDGTNERADLLKVLYSDKEQAGLLERYLREIVSIVSRERDIDLNQVFEHLLMLLSMFAPTLTNEGVCWGGDHRRSIERAWRGVEPARGGMNL